MIHKLFYFGFLTFVASTILFIVSILTRYWILQGVYIRGIFEVCQTGVNVANNQIGCSYILTASNDPFVISTRYGAYRARIGIYIYISFGVLFSMICMFWRLCSCLCVLGNSRCVSWYNIHLDRWRAFVCRRQDFTKSHFITDDRWNHTCWWVFLYIYTC